ncbi:HAMP domain-containing sensor histidine kinase, partial [Brevibacillus centrosporus]|uniref:sensor histidine kinase n=3 Tax=Brevibacillus centrosporus TaxID=54910 RepID=UPI003D253E31
FSKSIFCRTLYILSRSLFTSQEVSYRNLLAFLVFCHRSLATRNNLSHPKNKYNTFLKVYKKTSAYHLSNGEVLLRGAAHHPEQLHEALQSMHGESTRLTKLVQDLLLLAKIDKAPTLAIQLKKTELHPLLIELEPHLQMLAGSRTVQVEISFYSKLQIDPDRMKQVILNLFQNAVQHTDPKQGNIKVSLKDAVGGVLLTVKDNGSGILLEHLPHLFERFYRIDTARTRALGGSGIGLAITQSIVEAHGCRISATSEPGKGSSFTVWLPLPYDKTEKSP